MSLLDKHPGSPPASRPAANGNMPLRSGRLTTPQILHGALAGVCLGALLLFLAAFIGVRQHRQAVQTVGRDSAPSIIDAQSIKASLADLDANVANELMVKPGQSSQSIEGYAQRRKEVGDSLIGAAENITYGDAERQPIRTMESALGDYEASVSRARTLHERQDDPAALAAYRQAYHLLEETLLPAADALSRANSDVLDRTYAGVKTMSALMIALVLGVGAALAFVLFFIQAFLSRRMRRTFNPALLVATVLTLCFLAYTLRAFHAAIRQLKVAKEDAFTSIQALWQARAVAYDANTDESRWLLDRAQAPGYEAAFYAKTAQLMQLPSGQSYDNVVAATQGTLPPGTKGYFAREMGNITFDGERDAALQMIRAFGVYYGDDRKIRALEHAGKHDAAVAYCISMAPGDSNWAFDQFDKGLGKTLDINRRAFDQAVAQGFQDLKGVELLGSLVAVSVVALAFVGLRPRLREYLL